MGRRKARIRSDNRPRPAYFRSFFIRLVGVLRGVKYDSFDPDTIRDNDLFSKRPDYGKYGWCKGVAVLIVS
jgi:hypothetical protein